MIASTGEQLPRRSPAPLKPRRVWRPDTRLQEDISDKLSALTHREARKLRFRVNFGSVVLFGDVEDPGLAHLAEATVQSVWGVQSIHNDIDYPSRHEDLAASSLTLESPQRSRRPVHGEKRVTNRTIVRH